MKRIAWVKGLKEKDVLTRHEVVNHKGVPSTWIDNKFVALSELNVIRRYDYAYGKGIKRKFKSAL